MEPYTLLQYIKKMFSKSSSWSSNRLSSKSNFVESSNKKNKLNNKAWVTTRVIRDQHIRIYPSSPNSG